MLSYNTKKKNVLEKVEDDCIDKNVVSKKANFIVVKYETNKKIIMCIGKVENENPQVVYIIF